MRDRLIAAWRKVGFWLTVVGTKMQGERARNQLLVNSLGQPSNDVADQVMAVINRESTLMGSLVERDVRNVLRSYRGTAYVPTDEEVRAGQHVREVCANGNGESVLPSTNGYVPCAQAHEPGRICILPEGHS